ncbi:hypothetical protein [Chryseobacterium lactis]|nr:hypothetical protein [Chryseobacterium lactis]
MSPVDSSKDQMSLKASGSALQHTSLLVESVAENDFDADKTFFDLPFTFFVKYILFWGSDANSGAMITSAAEFVHHYHLPKYLLFHNLKIRI